MAMRASQVVVQAMARSNMMRASQVVLQVIRRQGAPPPVVPPVEIPPPTTPPFVEPPLPPGGIGNLVGRVQRLVQDTTEQCFSEGVVRRQVIAEIERLARQRLFGDLLWIPGIRYKATYDLNDYGQWLAHATARATPAFPANLTTLNDSTQTFQSAGVIPGDRVRGLSSGAQGEVTSVPSETQIICSAGFHKGGLDRNDLVPVEDGHLFVIERPLQPGTVMAVRGVLYDGKELHWRSTEQFDRLKQGRNHKPGTPRYWTSDARELPTHIRVFPPPSETGQSGMVFPMAPHMQTWTHHLLALVYVNPLPLAGTDLSSVDALLQKEPFTSEVSVPLNMPVPFHHVVVWRAAASLLLDEGPCQDLPVAHACLRLAQLFLRLMGVPDG